MTRSRRTSSTSPHCKRDPFVPVGKFPDEPYKELIGLAAAYGLSKAPSYNIDPAKVTIIVNLDNPGKGAPYIESPTTYTFDFAAVYAFLKDLVAKDQAAKPENFVLKKTDLQGATLTQVRKPTGVYSYSKPMSSNEVAAYLKNFGGTLTAEFSSKTSFVVFNPAQYQSTKFKTLAKLGLIMFTYRELYEIIYFGKDSVEIDASKWLKAPTAPSIPKPAPSQPHTPPSTPEISGEPLPPGAPTPLFKGKYLGTKPYYFTNVTPVLESGNPTKCEKYYYGTGYTQLNNALQNVGGYTLEGLDLTRRQYLEDLIVQIQVEAKHLDGLYRGVSNSVAVDKYFKMQVGDTFVKDAFMSTSTNELTSKSFANWNLVGTRSVMIYFDVPADVKGMFITEMGEKEQLFPPRSGWTITSIEDSEDGMKRKIFARLFVDPAFKTLNKSGKTIKTISELSTTGRIIRDPALMEPFSDGAN